MDRREAIKRTSLALGGVISAPTLAVIMKGCSPSRTLEWQPKLFTPNQAMMMEEICERIIPATETPGAKGVGVPQFMEDMVRLVYKPEDRERFLNGVTSFEQTCQEQFNKPFIELTEEEQYSLLNPLNQQVAEEALADHRQGRSDRSDDYKPSFFRMVKELTLVGNYSSEVGATQELQFLDIPGNYDGCVPLEELGGKTWAT